MRHTLPHWLIARLPFHYGWIILACVCCAGVARQGGAVATLSVFVSPMTREFGWSRTAISGAVSLGGVLAAILSPLTEVQGADGVLLDIVAPAVVAQHEGHSVRRTDRTRGRAHDTDDLFQRAGNAQPVPRRFQQLQAEVLTRTNMNIARQILPQL